MKKLLVKFEKKEYIFKGKLTQNLIGPIKISVNEYISLVYINKKIKMLAKIPEIKKAVYVINIMIIRFVSKLAHG